MINTPSRLILASNSKIRAQLLTQAAVPFEQIVSPIDEESIKASLEAEGCTPRDIADALAEGKARKVSLKHPDAMVIGCDQTLSFKGALISKPTSIQDAIEQITAMSGERHKLLSAAVIYEAGEPKWRHVGEVRLTMRDLSAAYIEDYVTRNWDSIRWSVGGYLLEEEGIRLFSAVQGDYFHVLGLPLIELLSYLSDRKVIAS